MKKNVVVMLVLVAGLVFTGSTVFARGCCGGGGYGAAKGWGTDPASDPVYQQFLEDTAQIRKDIATDQAELNALMAGENPDKEQARELAGRIAENRQKLAALARENGFGPGAGACGGCGGGRGYNRGCYGGQVGYGGGPANCPNCAAVPQQQ
ncbi:MAG: hypothetical protein Kow0089_03960 [Desulfobulbaceae bacterium]